MDINRIPSSRQPLTEDDGRTITIPWFRFLERLSGVSGGDIVSLIESESIDRQTDNDTAGLATQSDLNDLAIEARTETQMPFPQEQLDDALLLGWMNDSGDSRRIDFSDGQTPYYIPAGDSFLVALYKQVLFAETIVVDGTLVVEGHLIMVD